MSDSAKQGNGRGRSLRALEGGRKSSFDLGTLTVLLGPADEPPFPVDLEVCEEDTFLVLSADPVIRPVETHPVRLMTDLLDQKPEIPGTVVRRGRRLLAVVHDLAQDPTCRVEWVRSALKRALEAAEQAKAARLSIPLLGSLHGRIPYRESMSSIREALKEAHSTLKQVFLVIPRDLLVGAEQLVGEWHEQGEERE